MMKPIRQLPPDVSLRIAAGEVIENPASVVKELIENALDAGAARVTVGLRDGGRSQVIVEDDGQGIPFAELPLAVERFATSKISEAGDLSGIGSFGFRGEALASVCAVSRFEIRSRPEGEEGGVLRAEGGVVGLHASLPCRRGTRVQAEDLFFNLPARRHFLKSAATETRRAVNVVKEYSAAFPRVAFRVLCEEREVFSSGGGDQSRAEALARVWGTSEAPKKLIVESGPLSLETFWLPAPGSRRRGSIIFFNGRRVRDAAVSAALSSCGEAASGNWMFFITVPAVLLDVNVHPGKAEVRCHSSLAVYDTVRRSVLDLVEGGSLPAESLRAFTAKSPAKWTPAREGGSPFPTRQGEVDFFARVGEPPFSPPAEGGRAPGVKKGRFITRLGSGYLLFEETDGLLIIDPHAAHERILFERLSSAGHPSLAQVVPLQVQLPPSLSHRAEEVKDELESLGFRFKAGPGAMVLESVPGGHPHGSGGDPLDMLRAAVAAIEDGRTPEFTRSGIPGASCRAAVKITDTLAPEEAEALLEDLFRCEEPALCPHGRPTFIRLLESDLTKLFARSEK